MIFDAMRSIVIVEDLFDKDYDEISANGVWIRDLEVGNLGTFSFGVVSWSIKWVSFVFGLFPIFHK